MNFYTTLETMMVDQMVAVRIRVPGGAEGGRSQGVADKSVSQGGVMGSAAGVRSRESSCQGGADG